MGNEIALRLERFAQAFRLGLQPVERREELGRHVFSLMQVLHAVFSMGARLAIPPHSNCFGKDHVRENFTVARACGQQASPVPESVT